MSRSSHFMAGMAAHEAGQNAEALRLIESCAATGDPVACYLLALWYRTGEGVIADHDRSERWMRALVRLAESGHAEAQWQLGQCLRFGDLFPLDIGRANHWLEFAAENGWAEAQDHLAWYLE